MEYAADVSSKIDRILFAARLDGNQMAPNTAACFVLVGLCLVLLDVRLRRRYPAEALGFGLVIVSFLCVLGYGYRAQALYGIAAFIPMALKTAIAFGCLAVAVLSIRPKRGVMGALTSTNAGGMAAQRLLPIAVNLPVVLGWLTTEGQSAGLYDGNLANARNHGCHRPVLYFFSALFARQRGRRARQAAGPWRPVAIAEGQQDASLENRSARGRARSMLGNWSAWTAAIMNISLSQIGHITIRHPPYHC